jgi:hypothetical protein
MTLQHEQQAEALEFFGAAQGCADALRALSYLL